MAPPPWPPNTPSLADLFRAYAPLVRRRARRAGVPAADVPDILQKVFLRAYTAIVERRLDASRPIGGWLDRTTWTVAKDLRNRKYTEHETPTIPADLNVTPNDADQEQRMHEAIDVHMVIERVLDRLTPEQRVVFTLRDLEDTPMEKIIEELRISSSTAYDRLKAARRAFAREWESMRESGVPVLAPFVLLGARDLIAADHVLPDLPPGFEDSLLRRLGDEIGDDLTRSTRPTSPNTPGGGSPGTVTLKPWQIGLGVLCSALAGAALHATLHLAGPRPISPTSVAVQERPSVATAPPVVDPVVTGTPAAPAPPPPPEATAAAAPPAESQVQFLDGARALVQGHDPAKALALLARVTAPDLAEERDALRRQAVAEQTDAGAR